MKRLTFITVCSLSSLLLLPFVSEAGKVETLVGGATYKCTPIDKSGNKDLLLHLVLIDSVVDEVLIL